MIVFKKIALIGFCLVVMSIGITDVKCCDDPDGSGFLILDQKRFQKLISNSPDITKKDFSAGKIPLSHKHALVLATKHASLVCNAICKNSDKEALNVAYVKQAKCVLISKNKAIWLVKFDLVSNIEKWKEKFEAPESIWIYVTMGGTALPFLDEVAKLLNE